MRFLFIIKCSYENLKTVFNNRPVYGYRRNKNLKDIIGQTTLRNNKVMRKNKTLTPGKCSPCRSRYNNLCCKQVESTTVFTSHQTQQTYKILHNTNCRSSNFIYLLQCQKCKIQYIGKTENPFNIRLNNHRLGGEPPNWGHSQRQNISVPTMFSTKTILCIKK